VLALFCGRCAGSAARCTEQQQPPCNSSKGMLTWPRLTQNKHAHTHTRTRTRTQTTPYVLVLVLALVSGTPVLDRESLPDRSSKSRLNQPRAVLVDLLDHLFDFAENAFRLSTATFLYVCPEPVLVHCSIKWRFQKGAGVFWHLFEVDVVLKCVMLPAGAVAMVVRNLTCKIMISKRFRETRRRSLQISAAVSSRDRAVSIPRVDKTGRPISI